MWQTFLDLKITNLWFFEYLDKYFDKYFFMWKIFLDLKITNLWFLEYLDTACICTTLHWEALGDSVLISFFKYVFQIYQIFQTFQIFQIFQIQNTNISEIFAPYSTERLSIQLSSKTSNHADKANIVYMISYFSLKVSNYIKAFGG